MTKKIANTLAALLLGLLCALPAARADDIDLYTNPAVNNLKAPSTILVLDLNLLGICDNVITNPNNNPACANLQATTTVSTLLSSIGGQGVLQNGIAGLPQSTLCALNALLPIPLVSQLLCPLLSGLGLTNLVSGLLGNVTGASGTLLSALPSATLQILNNALAAPLKVAGDPSTLLAVLGSLLTPLINSNVAIVVSHSNRGNATGTPYTINGSSYACSFADLATIPTTRAQTTSCSNGGYFLVGFTPLVNAASVTALLTKVTGLLSNALNPANLVTALNGLSLTPANLTPPFQDKENYDEIIHYLAGDKVYNAPLNSFDGLLALLGRDTSIENNGSYIAPPLACGSANVLNVQLTNSTGDGDSDADLARYFPSAAISDPTYSGTGLANLVTAAQNTGFMAGGKNIKLNSYFLIQNNLSSLTALTNVGANVLTYTNITGLLGMGQAAAQAMQPTLVVNASLLTPSLVINIASPSQTLNSAFFSIFKPLPNQQPRWNGNLKKLHIVSSGSTQQYVDVNGNNAIGTNGRIASTALTFWTDATKLGSLSADGGEATLGGAGQKIASPPGHTNSAAGARQLFYDTYTANVPSLAALNADTTVVQNDLQSTLDSSSTTDANALILYARGYNVTSASASATTLASVTARSQSQGLHGAVLHSRPVAINYGARSGYSAAHPDVRVVYGANDGFLRMVQSNTSTGTESGAESWAFMPRVVMNQQLGLLNNAAGGPFPYGPDGAPTALVIDRSGSGGPGDGIIDSSNSNDHAYVFFGLRRGGNYYYGLDVTNPDSPKIMWRIGPDGLYNSSGLVGGSSGWFTHLALTFSAPQAGLLNVSGTPTYVLVFGGGYNGGRDKNNNRLGKDLSGSSGNVGADDTLGNALYIVNAQTGALIWKAEQGTFNATTPFNSSTLTYSHPLLSDSIPSDVTLIDTDGDGYVDRLYVADTGGHLWRGDFAGSDPSKWTLAPVVSVGRHINSDPADDRRFFEAPDYVAVRGPNGNYDAIAFASGDREDPLSLSTQDALYVYRDPIITSGLTASQIITAENILKHNTDFTDVTTSCAQKSSACTLAIQGLTTGWKIQLSGSGEKAFSQPLTLGNTVYLSTFLPPSGATTCKPPEGGGNLYAVNISDSTPSASSSITSGGTARSRTAAAPGLPGELGMAGVTSALASGEIVSTSVRKYYPAYWRERRGDEETPVPQ